ncbi:gluconate 2-dehydrogenase subunit 3 family protein [Aestuariibacter sp. A3R04]|uniref:gluconate 2-dehydrogenase subunit 3 family protein n=1 Tax=Aestuariibacter sp. A3R04 TaxID=2841571 RepID=UPI001C09525F|nr:gluconate 2-dehydrogenase subunit 3 family protein [Aestuariibacter sp. A3R04]MBU3020741.1 gluconate 2-dehydrogenase subunit 3 family protein [Aestuariibacter sp. A3R04]
MNRRDLLKMITAATGVAFMGDVMAYVEFPSVPLKNTGFTKDDVAYMNEIGEIILPRTDTPGAKDADVGSMMAVLVADCYTPALQKTFRDGLVKLNETAKEKYNKAFLLLSDKEKLALLSELDAQARDYNSDKGLRGVDTARPNAWGPEEVSVVPHYFSLIKQLVLFCFFTSRVGGTQVLRYDPIPTRYDGNVPYKKGQGAWATS